MTVRAASNQVVVPLQALMDAMSDGVLITDENGYRTYANSALNDLVGGDPCHPAADASAPPWLVPSHRGRFEEYLRLARVGKLNQEIVSLDWTLVSKTGVEIAALMKVIPMHSTGGGPVPLMWLVVPDRASMDPARADAARQAQLEESLRRISAELERLGFASSAESAFARASLPELDRLSPRETEVLEHLLNGHRVTSIATELSVSEHTVRNHLKSMFRKLSVHSQAELVGLVRHGRRS